MNWSSLFQILLNVIEKNPQLLEQLITILLNLFVSHPETLNKAVTVGIAHAEKSLTPPVV